MKKPGFMAMIKHHHGELGTDTRVIIRYNLSPAAQLALLNKAIIGYDTHHPDASQFDGLKFPIPPIPPTPPPVKTEKTDSKENPEDWEYYCG